ncbi:MAG: PIG-L family deacetylase [Sumerlaeia bacterium]
MRILYIFPHPDDESFGPGPVMASQVRAGHQVGLLTLTKGEATKVRHDLGLSKEEMGAIRARETEAAAQALGVSWFRILDLPDGEFLDLDPRKLEAPVAAHIHKFKPDVVVTYEPYGVSGFPDHIAIHPVVKRVYCELRERAGPSPRRLAFFCLYRDQEPDHSVRLFESDPERVGCVVTPSDEDFARGHEALACYETYAETIARHDPLGRMGREIGFQLFQENPRPRLTDLFEGL